MMSAADVAQIGLSGALKGKTVIVPGLLNWLSCLTGRLIPGQFFISISSAAMNRSVKKIAK